MLHAILLSSVDIKNIKKIRTNRLQNLVTLLQSGKLQVCGYGVVVGCAKGDKNAEMCIKMLEINNKTLSVRNCAYVSVSASIDPYTYSGLPVDILVSPCDTCDISNGYLIPTELYGLDGVVYATAAGELPTSVKGKGTISKGGVVVNLPPTVAEAFEGKLHLQLLKPDANNAVKITKTINLIFGNIAIASSPAMIQVQIPKDKAITEFIAELQSTEVEIIKKPSIEIFPDANMILIDGDIFIDKNQLSILIDTFKLDIETDNPAFRAESVNDLIESLATQEENISTIMMILEYLCKYNKIDADLRIVYTAKQN